MATQQPTQQVATQQSAMASAVTQPELPLEQRLAMLPPRGEGYRPAAIRESRIKDRPYKPVGDSSLSIKIELDLEVEVSLLALFLEWGERENKMEGAGWEC